jgi:hypothetical protein
MILNIADRNYSDIGYCCFFRNPLVKLSGFCLVSVFMSQILIRQMVSGTDKNKFLDCKMSIYSKSEHKEIARLVLRDEHCNETIVEFPKNNEVAVYVSHGLSDAGSFLFAFFEKYGVIDEAYISTWTISKNNVLKLIEYIDQGKIKKLTFLLNDGMLKTANTKPIYGLLRSEFDSRKIEYAVANSHAKVQAYKSGENCCVISGSGNWSLNPRIEDYVLIGGEKIYNFTKDWITKIVRNG